MSVKEITRNSAKDFYGFCPEWKFDGFFSYEGLLRDSHIAWGSYDEDERATAVLLAELQPGGICEIRHIGFKKGHESSAGFLTVFLKREMREMMMKEINCTFFTDEPGVSDILKISGFGEDIHEGTIFRIDGLKWNNEGKDGDNPPDENVIDFDDVSVDELIRYQDRFGKDIDKQVDFYVAGGIDSRFSVAAMSEEKMVGYILCSTEELSLEISKTYVEQDHKVMMGKMMMRLMGRYEDAREEYPVLRACAINEVSEKLIRKVFADSIISERQLVTKSFVILHD